MDDRDDRLSTGVAGLDEILFGGLIPQRTYLVRGGPGTGKTTAGLHFLLSGQPQDSLMATLGEGEADIRDNAARVNLPLADVPVLSMSPLDSKSEHEDSYSLLESWEVEGRTVHDRILEYAREHRPRRVFIDSISTLRYQTPDTYQFRRQVLSLFRELENHGATVLVTAQMATDVSDEDLLSLSAAIINLEDIPGGRACRVIKTRGSGFAEGRHHYELTADGMVLYPRMIPGEHGRAYRVEAISSGVEGLDALTHGGIERGTVTIVSGPTGAGKTSLGTLFMTQAAKRGERSVIYSFDEGVGTFAGRGESLNMPVRQLMEQGNLVFDEIEAQRYNPDQFAAKVRCEVEQRGACVVMLDSMVGYQRAIRGEELVARIHALCRYLVSMGATVVMVNEVHSIGDSGLQVTEYGISYLADTIILLRYMEATSELRKNVGVLKKRTGDFEKTLRPFEFNPGGISVGLPIREIRGILRGVPEYTPREAGFEPS